MKKKSKRTRKPVTVKPPSVDKILDALPLIAPIPTAWAIGVALYERLGWPVLVVGIAALGIDHGEDLAIELDGPFGLTAIREDVPRFDEHPGVIQHIPKILFDLGSQRLLAAAA